MDQKHHPNHPVRNHDVQQNVGHHPDLERNTPTHSKTRRIFRGLWRYFSKPFYE